MFLFTVNNTGSRSMLHAETDMMQLFDIAQQCRIYTWSLPPDQGFDLLTLEKNVTETLKQRKKQKTQIAEPILPYSSVVHTYSALRVSKQKQKLRGKYQRRAQNRLSIRDEILHDGMYSSTSKNAMNNCFYQLIAPQTNICCFISYK